MSAEAKRGPGLSETAHRQYLESRAKRLAAIAKKEAERDALVSTYRAEAEAQGLFPTDSDILAAIAEKEAAEHHAKRAEQQEAARRVVLGKPPEPEAAPTGVGQSPEAAVAVPGWSPAGIADFPGLYRDCIASHRKDHQPLTWESMAAWIQESVDPPRRRRPGSDEYSDLHAKTVEGWARQAGLPHPKNFAG